MPIKKTTLPKPVMPSLVPSVLKKPGKKFSPILRVVSLALGSIASLAVIAVIVGVTGAYAFRWHNQYTVTIARAVAFPSVMVNNHWRSYYIFLDTVRALDQSYSQPGALAANGLTEKPSRAQIEQLVLDRLVKDEIVRQLAEKRGVEITQSALDSAMRDVIDQTGSEAEVKTRIKELYGWEVATFADRVVRPFLFRQRLQEKIAADNDLNKSQQQKMDALLVRVQAGKEDFGAIADEVNEDATKGLKGDYGIFGKGERDQAVEDAAFALTTGATSGIIRTTQGFHILKLVAKIPADEKTGDPEKVQVSHIFLAAKQLDTWLSEQAASQKVRIVLSGYRWDSQAAMVIPSKSTSPDNTNQSSSTVPTNTNQ